MDAAAIAELTQLLLAGALVLSVLFGAIAQRTHFCTMGAVSDIVNIGDWNRMKMWALALAVAMGGFHALVLAGRIDPGHTLYASERWIWLSAIVGGLMFGFGMVLASGCGSKTLVRVGTGNLKSLVVLLVLGITSFATLRGITAVVRVATVDQVALPLPAPGTLGGLIGGSAGAVTGLVLAALLALWALRTRESRNADVLLGGLGIGGVVLAFWALSGWLGHLPEHPDTLQPAWLATNSGRIEAMSFTAPVAYAFDWLMFFSDKNKLLTIGVVSVFGVMAGSALMARIEGSFRWESFRDSEDMAHHLVGGALMGVGGVTAMGCTIGQGLSGMSTLSFTSMVALTSIIAGSVAAFRYQVWRLDRLG